jgi:hypothetical protein
MPACGVRARVPTVMTTRHDDHRKEISDHRETGLETVDNPADDPQTRPAIDMDVGLADRVIPEDT